MKTLAIFSEPEAASSVVLAHDNGIKTTGVPGQADGRAAHLLPLDEGQYIEGHGAWLSVKWADGAAMDQHGALKFQTRTDGRAVFESDVIRKPTSF